jgi:hypothetical protein
MFRLLPEATATRKGYDHQGNSAKACHEKATPKKAVVRAAAPGNSHEEASTTAVSLGRLVVWIYITCCATSFGGMRNFSRRGSLDNW